jgi:hypothetical protein
MLTVYKSDLKADLIFRKNELAALTKEREDQQFRGSYNPFKRKSSRDLSENIRQCRREINKIKENLANESY